MIFKVSGPLILIIPIAPVATGVDMADMVSLWYMFSYGCFLGAIITLFKLPSPLLQVVSSGSFFISI